MDLSKAEKTRALLNTKDDLVKQRNEISSCTCIRGDIVTGQNGRPFRIEKGHFYIDYIIKGLGKDIEKIEREIYLL